MSAPHRVSFSSAPYTPIIRIYLQVRGQLEKKNQQTAVITAGIDLESIFRAARILKPSTAWGMILTFNPIKTQ